MGFNSGFKGLTQPEVKFMHSTTTNNDICIISDAQKTTALQSNVFLTLIHRLLVTNTGRSLSTAQTPHSLTTRITNAGSYINETS